jgi:hypothetical protein
MDQRSKSRAPGYPYGEFDAKKWADEFERLFPGVVDPELMLGWFANAIMTGYDKAKNEGDDDGTEDRRGSTQVNSDQE